MAESGTGVESSLILSECRKYGEARKEDFYGKFQSGSFLHRFPQVPKDLLDEVDGPFWSKWLYCMEDVMQTSYSG